MSFWGLCTQGIVDQIARGYIGNYSALYNLPLYASQPLLSTADYLARSMNNNNLATPSKTDNSKVEERRKDEILISPETLLAEHITSLTSRTSESRPLETCVRAARADIETLFTFRNDAAPLLQALIKNWVNLKAVVKENENQLDVGHANLVDRQDAMERQGDFDRLQLECTAKTMQILSQRLDNQHARFQEIDKRIAEREKENVQLHERLTKAETTIEGVIKDMLAFDSARRMELNTVKGDLAGTQERVVKLEQEAIFPEKEESEESKKSEEEEEKKPEPKKEPEAPKTVWLVLCGATVSYAYLDPMKAAAKYDALGHSMYNGGKAIITVKLE